MSKGFHIACNDINAAKRFVVYSGSDTFSMGGGITAISLYDLMREIGQME
ncbi:MAG: hypothetical protein JST63_04960 [Bacteroidetes bacterium]|nr:hypothetical protein [Bacteroidota bacterium]